MFFIFKKVFLYTLFNDKGKLLYIIRSCGSFRICIFNLNEWFFFLRKRYFCIFFGNGLREVMRSKGDIKIVLFSVFVVCVLGSIEVFCGSYVSI